MASSYYIKKSKAFYGKLLFQACFLSNIPEKDDRQYLSITRPQNSSLSHSVINSILLHREPTPP